MTTESVRRKRPKFWRNGEWVLQQHSYSPDLAPVDSFITQAQVLFDNTEILKIAGGTTEDSERRIFPMIPTMEAPLGGVCD